MKSIKRMSCLLLALALAASVLAVPALAANYSASDRGSGTGYTWNSYLSTTSSSGTARIVVYRNPSGSVPTDLTAALDGSVYTQKGDVLKLSASQYGTNVDSITASRTREPESGDEVIGAKCAYTALGYSAGKELKVGTT